MPENEKTNRAAFFDVDGTVTDTNVVDYYVAFRLKDANPIYRAAWLAGFIPKALQFLTLDKISRTRFVRKIYQEYKGVNVAEFLRWNKRSFPKLTQKKIRKGALEAVKMHKKAGNRIILVSGGVEERIAPLAQFLEVDDFLATKLVQQEGHYTGEIQGNPLVDEEKVGRVKQYAMQEGIDLSLSWAYADSRSDIPFLELVGNPVAVSKELAGVAQSRHWRIEIW